MMDTSKHFLFISNILKRKVLEKETGAAVGKIVDLVASTKELYPKVVYAVVRVKGRKSLETFPWNKLEDTDYGVYFLKGEAKELLKPYVPQEGEFFVKEEFLDMQIVDIHGSKVVRVNDLHFLKEKDILWVVHADVGLRGLVRRLGIEKFVDFLTDLLFSYKLKDRFISWKFVQSLAEPGKSLSVLKLKVAQKKLSGLWPADLAEIIEDLGVKERMNLFRALDIETAANTIKEMNAGLRNAIFEAIGKDRGALILSELSEDEIADIIVELPHKKADALLHTLKKDKADKVMKIASLPENEAGSFMELKYTALSPELTLKEAFEKVKELAGDVELINYIYIVNNDNNLIGVTTMRKILINKPELKLSEIMNTNIIKVEVDTDRKEVIRIFVKYDFDVLPVTDAHNKFVGVIALKNAIEKLIPQLSKER